MIVFVIFLSLSCMLCFGGMLIYIGSSVTWQMHSEEISFIVKLHFWKLVVCIK